MTYRPRRALVPRRQAEEAPVSRRALVGVGVLLAIALAIVVALAYLQGAS